MRQGKCGFALTVNFGKKDGAEACWIKAAAARARPRNGVIVGHVDDLLLTSDTEALGSLTRLGEILGCGGLCLVRQTHLQRQRDS